MNLSKLKLDIYDFLGIILPGLIAASEGWIFLRGWDSFTHSMSHIGAINLTLLLVFAFGIGHLVQELSDLLIQWTKGARYKYRARDRFWASGESKIVRQLIARELGHDLPTVDAAYDFCLTRVCERFPKRDIFIATSDLSRSFVAMGFVALFPAAKIAFWQQANLSLRFLVFGAELLLLFAIAALAWRRMLRYRYLADVTVFRVYPAVMSANASDKSPKGKDASSAQTAPAWHDTSQSSGPASHPRPPHSI